MGQYLNSCGFFLAERHISIQSQLEVLEQLVDLNGGTLFRFGRIKKKKKTLDCTQTLYLCLFTLVYLSPTAGRKSCPLCPEEKFKACYSHKLRRHLHNLHWKVYVEFEGVQTRLASVTSRHPPLTQYYYY